MDDITGIDTVPMKPSVKLLWSSQPLHASTGTTGWHQDRFCYHSGADAVDVLICWMSFVDVNMDMGPLQVLPGSYRLELQDHIPEPEHAGSSIRGPDLMPMRCHIRTVEFDEIDARVDSMLRACSRCVKS